MHAHILGVHNSRYSTNKNATTNVDERGAGDGYEDGVCTGPVDGPLDPTSVERALRVIVSAGPAGQSVAPRREVRAGTLTA